MLGIGFWELSLIALVALAVLGPEQLSTTAKMLGKVLSQVQCTIQQVRADIQAEED